MKPREILPSAMPASHLHARASYRFLWFLLLVSAIDTLAGDQQTGSLAATGDPSSICGVTARNVAEMADVVFTGKVDSMVVDGQGLVAIVRVKRILKTNGEFGGPEGIVSGNHVAAAMSERFFESAGTVLATDCPHRDVFYAVRVRDTKIFCARVTGRSSLEASHQLHPNKSLFPFQLVAISLPVNLQILEQFADLEGEFLANSKSLIR